MSTTSLKESQPRHITPEADSKTPYVGDPKLLRSPRNLGRIPRSAIPAICLKERKKGSGKEERERVREGVKERE